MRWTGRPLPRHQVNLDRSVLRAVLSSLRDGSVVTGSDLAAFEAEFAQRVGVTRARGTASGRTALLIALEAMQLQPGDEVIVPDYTLAAMPALLISVGLRPVFVDIDPQTHQIDAERIEEAIGPKTRAILPTHLFGLACDIERIMEIADEHSLLVLEDCAQSCGTTVSGRPVGSFGHLALFSFNTGKNIACFGGGMLVGGRDPELWARAEALLDACVSPRRDAVLKRVRETVLSWALTSRPLFPFTLWPALVAEAALGGSTLDTLTDEDEPTAPPPLPLRREHLANLQARVGRAQLARLDAVNARTARNAARVAARLEGVPGIRVAHNTPEVGASYAYLKVEAIHRDAVRRGLMRQGIDSHADDMSACSTIPFFAAYARDCPVSASVHATSMEIPNGFALRPEDIERVAEALARAAEAAHRAAESASSTAGNST